MRTIDLRRDTITLPIPEMVEKAFKAPLGDSVYGEDPKQEELEQYAAEKLGKEEAIFVPSGTMGNLIAVLAHTRRGDEIILEENAHIRTSETGGAATVGGVMLKTIRGKDGAPDPSSVEGAIRADDIHYPKTSLICLENTHYRYGGIVPPLDKFYRIRAISHKHGIPIHLDGARLFNASVYLEVDVRTLTELVDTVMVSLSKGLGAPVGSILCGPRDFIKEAKRYRKMLGGGMRQTGWLCACGLIALSERSINQIQEDHANTRLLAENIAAIPGLEVDLDRVHTNFVFGKIIETGFDAAHCIKHLARNGILATSVAESMIRFMISKEVRRSDIVFTIDVMRNIFNKQLGS